MLLTTKRVIYSVEIRLVNDKGVPKCLLLFICLEIEAAINETCWKFCLVEAEVHLLVKRICLKKCISYFKYIESIGRPIHILYTRKYRNSLVKSFKFLLIHWFNMRFKCETNVYNNFMNSFPFIYPYSNYLDCLYSTLRSMVR